MGPRQIRADLFGEGVRTSPRTCDFRRSLFVMFPSSVLKKNLAE